MDRAFQLAYIDRILAQQREFDREDVLEEAMRLFWSQGNETTSVLRHGSLWGSFALNGAVERGTHDPA